MLRRKLKGLRPNMVQSGGLLVKEVRRPGKVMLLSAAMAQGPGLRPEPAQVLAAAAARLQAVVAELDDLMFEAPAVGASARVSIHDAMAQTLEALQGSVRPRPASSAAHRPAHRRRRNCWPGRWFGPERRFPRPRRVPPPASRFRPAARFDSGRLCKYTS
ncbi:MAG: hypothetical protein WCO00_12890 [Rhodospirillaceae bacterium]